MLSCIIGSKSINSFDYDEAKLREWSNKEILKCPECNERVIYCKGDYKIPYFKHEIGSECSGNKYYEPMTEEHINGIKALYNRLKEIEGVENLEVEKYIPNTKQRPDIYFEYRGERYCIEYQCSPISTQYNKRHELYQFEGINDIWILGTEKYNFEKFIKKDNCIYFNEKKIKTIEDEIDRGSSPLLYLKDDEIYKINSNGFVPIVRNEYKKFRDNSPLKKIVKITLNKLAINSISVENILKKENLSISEIHAITKDTIMRCENLILGFNKKYDEDVVFKYNLAVDRFPMYQYYLAKYINVFYDIRCKRLENDINEYVRFLELNQAADTYTMRFNDEYGQMCKFKKDVSKHLRKINFYILSNKNKILYQSDTFDDMESFNKVCEKIKKTAIDIIINNYKKEKEIEDIWRENIDDSQRIISMVKQYKHDYSMNNILKGISSSNINLEYLWEELEREKANEFLQDYKEAFERALEEVLKMHYCVYNKISYKSCMIGKKYGYSKEYKYEFPRFKKDRFNNIIKFRVGRADLNLAPTIDCIIYLDLIKNIYKLKDRYGKHIIVSYDEKSKCYKVLLDGNIKIYIDISKIKNIEVKRKTINLSVSSVDELNRYVNNELADEIRRIKYGQV